MEGVYMKKDPKNASAIAAFAHILDLAGEGNEMDSFHMHQKVSFSSSIDLYYSFFSFSDYFDLFVGFAIMVSLYHKE